MNLNPGFLLHLGGACATRRYETTWLKPRTYYDDQDNLALLHHLSTSYKTVVYVSNSPVSSFHLMT